MTWIAVSPVTWIAVSPVTWIAVSPVTWIAVSPVTWIAVSPVTWIVAIGPAFLVRIGARRFGKLLADRGLCRANYAGRAIPTSYGALLLLVSLPFYFLALSLPVGAAWAVRLAAAGIGFGVLGFVDDRWGDRSAGGLRGHFRRLLVERQITTGAMKALFGAVIALALAFTLAPAGLFDLFASGALIALTANGLNLVDTRPGRAVTLFLLGAVACMLTLQARGAPIPPALWTLPCAAAAYWPVERARLGMLGDSGANLLGGCLGCAFAMSQGFPARTILVVALIAFHLFTEKRSLNAFIAERPLLRTIDRWIQGPDPVGDVNPEGRDGLPKQ